MTRARESATAVGIASTPSSTPLTVSARPRRRSSPARPVRDLIGRDDSTPPTPSSAATPRRRLTAGAAVVGRKIGLTSPAVQAAARRRPARLRRPVRRHGRTPTARESRPTRVLQPRVEAEVAFVLGADLADGPSTPSRSARRSTTPSRRWRSAAAGSPAGTSPSATPSPTTPPAGAFVLGAEQQDARRVRPRRRRR